MDISRKPDWTYWNAYDLLEVWQAIALSIDRDPASIVDLRNRRSSSLRDGPIRLFNGGEEFDRRLDLLSSAIEFQPSQFVPANDPYNSFDLPEMRKVIPAGVRDFFLARGFSVPTEWRTLQSVAASRWPWGDYETKPLGVMAEAVHQLWSTFDPEDPETAPTQPDVTKFITKRLTEVGYSNPDAIASAMATIIRHEKAPVGRRRKARR